MDRLFQGIVDFKEQDFEQHQNLFHTLKDNQKPHTLFIGCSDSRIVPNLITNTLPGELFMVRNVGNMVPPWRDTEDYVATTSAVEYSVLALNVKNIVVCGHSNCGACSLLLQPNQVIDQMPHVKKWLELMQPTKEKILQKYPNLKPEAYEWLLEQYNIVEQLKNLLTYPFIKERYLAKELNIFGWYYIIETGEVYNYNIDNKTFELVKSK